MNPPNAKTVKLEPPADAVRKGAPVSWISALSLLLGWVLVFFQTALLCVCISERFRRPIGQLEVPPLTLENLGLALAGIVGVNFFAVLAFLSFLCAERCESKRIGMVFSAVIFIVGASFFLLG